MGFCLTVQCLTPKVINIENVLRTNHVDCLLIYKF